MDRNLKSFGLHLPVRAFPSLEGKTKGWEEGYLGEVHGATMRKESPSLRTEIRCLITVVINCALIMWY